MLVFGITNLARADRRVAPNDFADLQAQLGAATPGETVSVPAGVYVVTAPIVVPPGVTLAGAGAMMLGANGLPAGFGAGTRTVLRGTATTPGDLVSLRDGTTLRGVAVEDAPSTHRGVALVASGRALP